MIGYHVQQDYPHPSTMSLTIPQLTALSVTLRMTPPPKSLAESRAILRVLQQFGQVTAFKALRACSPPFPSAALSSARLPTACAVSGDTNITCAIGPKRDSDDGNCRFSVSGRWADGQTTARRTERAGNMHAGL